MSEAVLILGTRGSDLALTQARMTREALGQQGIASEIRVIKTIGDKRPDLKLSEFGAQVAGVHDKGIFTKELEEALLAGEIDFAVHSLKDVPTELAEPFLICATLPRAPVSDVILSARAETVASLAASNTPTLQPSPLAGKIVATSSVRRAALLKWRFPGVKTIDIRGNVPTRIEKLLKNPEWEAIILARAGMERLGYFREGSKTLAFGERPVHVHEFAPHFFPPAASQGAVAMETLKTNRRARAALALINHPATFAQVTAERSFLAALKAGCQTPVGITTVPAGENGSLLRIDAVVFCEGNLDRAPRTASLTLPVSEASRAGDLLLSRLT